MERRSEVVSVMRAAADEPSIGVPTDTAYGGDVMRANSIVLAFSGGGLRAAAFAQGSLEALRTVKTPEGDLLHDVSIISSVSGSSLTAAYYGLYGRDGLGRFRSDVRVPGFESGLRLSLANPGNIVRMSSGGLNVREDFVDVLNRKAFRGATFTDLYRHPHVDFPRDAALQRSDQGRNVNRRASLSRRGRGELA